VEEVLRSFADVAEYRVEVDADRSLAELRVLIEPSAQCSEVMRLTERVQAELQNAFGLRIAVSSVGCGELPRFEMKARRWVRDA